METKPYLHKTQYYETDGMGIVHHSNYIRWFEEARVDLLEQIGLPYQTMEARGIQCPVLSVQCDYKTMTRFGETVEISASILSYTGVKITLGYIIRDSESGQIRCTGQTQHCFLTAAGRPTILRRADPEMDAIFSRFSPAAQAD